MYNKELEDIIEMALADGQITPKEREMLHNKAMEYGVSIEEIDIVIDGRLYEIQQELKQRHPQQPQQQSTWQPAQPPRAPYQQPQPQPQQMHNRPQPFPPQSNASKPRRRTGEMFLVFTKWYLKYSLIAGVVILIITLCFSVAFTHKDKSSTYNSYETTEKVEHDKIEHNSSYSDDYDTSTSEKEDRSSYDAVSSQVSEDDNDDDYEYSSSSSSSNSKSWDEKKDKAKETYDKAKEKAKDIYEKNKDKAKDYYDKNKDKVKDKYENTKEKAKDKWNDLKDKWGN